MASGTSSRDRYLSFWSRFQAALFRWLVAALELLHCRSRKLRTIAGWLWRRGLGLWIAARLLAFSHFASLDRVHSSCALSRPSRGAGTARAAHRPVNGVTIEAGAPRSRSSMTLIVALASVAGVIVALVAIVVTLRGLRDQLWLQTFPSTPVGMERSSANCRVRRVVPAPNSSSTTFQRTSRAAFSTSPAPTSTFARRSTSCIVAAVSTTRHGRSGGREWSRYCERLGFRRRGRC